MKNIEILIDPSNPINWIMWILLLGLIFVLCWQLFNSSGDRKMRAMLKIQRLLKKMSIEEFSSSIFYYKEERPFNSYPWNKIPKDELKGILFGGIHRRIDEFITDADNLSKVKKLLILVNQAMLAGLHIDSDTWKKLAIIAKERLLIQTENSENKDEKKLKHIKADIANYFSQFTFNYLDQEITPEDLLEVIQEIQPILDLDFESSQTRILQKLVTMKKIKVKEIGEEVEKLDTIQHKLILELHWMN